jgi:hypothetical protein
MPTVLRGERGFTQPEFLAVPWQCRRGARLRKIRGRSVVRLAGAALIGFDPRPARRLRCLEPTANFATSSRQQHRANTGAGTLSVLARL